LDYVSVLLLWFNKVNPLNLHSIPLPVSISLEVFSLGMILSLLFGGLASGFPPGIYAIEVLPVLYTIRTYVCSNYDGSKGFKESLGAALVMALLFSITFASYLALITYQKSLSSTYFSLEANWLLSR